MTYERYAIYYTPRGTLAAAGAAWLGWDPALGCAVPHPKTDIDLAGLTERPRKYGFHATIKPPFALAEGEGATDLRAAFDDICAELKPVTLKGLQFQWMGGFLALTPQQTEPELERYAADVLRQLDRFRAPLSQVELARRAHPRLTEAQRRNLLEWGYPYVMESFRFHLTLTGRVPPAARDAVEAAAVQWIGPHVPRPFVMEDLTLLGAGADGLFHEIYRAALD